MLFLPIPAITILLWPALAMGWRLAGDLPEGRLELDAAGE